MQARLAILGKVHLCFVQTNILYVLALEMTTQAADSFMVSSFFNFPESRFSGGRRMSEALGGGAGVTSLLVSMSGPSSDSVSDDSALFLSSSVCGTSLSDSSTPPPTSDSELPAWSSDESAKSERTW